VGETLNLAEAEGRAQRYWTIDGLPELIMGTLWMVWGGAFLVGELLPRGPVWNMYWMFTPALLALSGVAAVHLTKRLKARITFPRTGYVEWREPSRTHRMITAAVAMVTAALLVVIVARGRAEGMPSIVAPVLGVILSLSFVVASLSQRAPYLFSLAGVALVLGLVFGASRTGWDAVNWMFVALGAVTACVGALRLGRFMRRHPLEPVR
jgi:hypothetical protein